MASILIADDDPNILRALEFLMREAGHEVMIAADGEAVLALIAKTSPELVLLDVMMPKMNGFDVCNAIRNEAQHERLRIIMLTAKGRESDKRTGLELGVDAYLTKPFAVRDVLDCVASVLNRPAAPAGQRI